MNKCEICGKTSNYGNKIKMNRSKVSKRVKRKQMPNIQRRKIITNGMTKHMYICTRCIRSEKKKLN